MYMKKQLLAYFILSSLSCFAAHRGSKKFTATSSRCNSLNNQLIFKSSCVNLCAPCRTGNDERDLDAQRRYAQPPKQGAIDSTSLQHVRQEVKIRRQAALEQEKQFVFAQLSAEKQEELETKR